MAERWQDGGGDVGAAAAAGVAVLPREGDGGKDRHQQQDGPRAGKKQGSRLGWASWYRSTSETSKGSERSRPDGRVGSCRDREVTLASVPPGQAVASIPEPHFFFIYALAPRIHCFLHLLDLFSLPQVHLQVLRICDFLLDAWPHGHCDFLGSTKIARRLQGWRSWFQEGKKKSWMIISVRSTLKNLTVLQLESGVEHYRLHRYDIALFMAHRKTSSGEVEVKVRFNGFRAEEDKWINVWKAIRQQSIPLESSRVPNHCERRSCPVLQGEQ